jgi:hypothetical protein
MTVSLASRRTPVNGASAASEPASVAASSAPVAAIRHIALLVSPADMRVLHRELAIRLERNAAVRVTLLRGRAERFLPTKVDLLLDLERLLYRLPGPRLADRIAPDRPMLEQPFRDDRPDLTIDLSGTLTEPDERTICLRCDGLPGWEPMIGALIAGRMPIIELLDGQSGAVLARGEPCADNASTLSDALECVLARIVTLAPAAIRRRAAAAIAPAAGPRPLPQPARLAGFVQAELKTVAWRVVKQLYRLCCHGPHWRTCWRFVDGPDLWDARTLAGTSWNVIPDPGLRFYADPFPFVHDGKTFVFVEDLDHRVGKGVISVVPFDERGPAGPARPVLEEPWHLSYPFVFTHAGQIWMIPESSAAKRISLYRADRFPDRWVLETTLVSGYEASDATVIRHGGLHWMFAATRDGAGSWSDTLSIFSAPDLLGPWQPHPLNPVLVDQRAARPAGAMRLRGGRLWRPVQDCTDGYGTGIGLAEVVRLDREGFEQKVHCVLKADPTWPGRRFHTLNRVGALELIDGAAYSPRSRRLARALEGWSGRREPPEHWSRAM